VLIATTGTGWAFFINGASFLAVLVSLSMLDKKALLPPERSARARGSFLAGLRYVAGRSDLIVILVMLALVGTFCLNFPIFISAMAVQVFRGDARAYGMLSSIMAVGTLLGSLLSARHDRPRFATLPWACAVLAIGFVCAAFAPGYWTFAAALALIGSAYLTFVVATNALMQLSTEQAMRGRVMALRVGVALGGTPIGAPTVGWVSDHFGPRWSLGVGAAAALSAAIVAVLSVRKKGRSDASVA